MNKFFEEDSSLLWKLIFPSFTALLQELSQKNQNIVVGVSGGSSVNGFYDYIKQHKKTISPDIWGKIIFVFLDERLVPLDHEDSNYKAVHKTFFEDLIDSGYITSEQIIRIDISNPNFLLDTNSQVKNIDIALLGVGPDGHVCSLFPHHEGLHDESMGYILVDNSPKPPSKRISISKSFLKSIKNVYIFFMGDTKKHALDMFLSNENTRECPACLVLDCPNLNLVSNIID